MSKKELWITCANDVAQILNRINDSKVEAGNHIRDLTSMIPTIIGQSLGQHRDDEWWRIAYYRIGRTVQNLVGAMDVEKFCQLLVDKHSAYGAEPLARGGMQGILNRMDSKCCRAVNLQLGVSEAHDENFEDTMLDILGYAILGLVMIDNLGLVMIDNLGTSKVGKLTVEVTMMVAQKAVGDFHEKHGFDKGLDLTKFSKDGSTATHLLALGNLLKDRAKYMESGAVMGCGYDTRIMRAHLICEELGELLEAMANGDEVETLDGLADLVYVIAGTAVAFNLPLDDAFIEVHKSNMTKAVKAGGADDMRCRTKGASYVPPDIASVLSRHRRNEKTSTKASYQDLLNKPCPECHAPAGQPCEGKGQHGQSGCYGRMPR